MSNFWCEIDLNAVEHNLNIIKKMIGDKKIIGVIKGDAYGLGIETLAKYLENKVDILAVGNLEESKKISVNKDILILSPLCTIDDFEDDRENLIFSIDNEEIIEKLPKDKRKRVHIYLDTGMNRMGIKVNRIDAVIQNLKDNYPNIKIEGLYTHLHKCKDVKYTVGQVAKFKKAVEKYKGEIPFIHCLASSGILSDEIRKAASFTTAARGGNIIYGYAGYNKGIKKSFTYYAVPVNVCKVAKGEQVGYGGLFTAKSDMTIGVLECGNVHGMGITRDIKNNPIYDMFKVLYRSIKKRYVIFNGGRPVNILGRPNMNVTLIDMTGIDRYAKLKVDLSPVISESSIDKIYIGEVAENNGDDKKEK